MTPTDLVTLYAELSLGLAGFIGVVAAFGRRSVGPNHSAMGSTEHIRFLVVALMAGCVFLSCMTFVALLAGEYSQQQAMMGAGVANLLIIGPVACVLVPRAVRHVRDPDTTAQGWALWLTLVAVAGILALLVWTVVAGSNFFPFALSMSLELLVGLWMFVRLLARPNTDS